MLLNNDVTKAINLEPQDFESPEALVRAIETKGKLFRNDALIMANTILAMRAQEERHGKTKYILPYLALAISVCANIIILLSLSLRS